jgi:hypothetical protein
MTYQQAQARLKVGLLAKREKWPDSTWLSPRAGEVRLRVQKTDFDSDGVYLNYEPTQEDFDATDWLCRPS